MKRNKLFIAGLVTVFVALVSLTLVSSTWAKYTSTATGSDTARVAKWEWTFDAQSDGDAEFDLLDTINDTKGGADETDVVDGLIAPGVQGSFVISFTNNSEVTSNVTVALSTSGSADLPIQYSLSSDFNTFTTDLSTLGWTQENVAAKTAANSQTIYWRWVFTSGEAGDASDTLLGLDGTKVLKVTINVEFTQVD